MLLLGGLFDDTLPALRRVHVASGFLRGTYLQMRNPQLQRQANLLEEYKKAALATGPDGRILLKQGANRALVGPVLEFVNLAQTDHEAVRFTRAYGPLVWHQTNLRVLSRETRTHERRRGVSGRTGRIADRFAWSMRLAEFWQEQQRFRATIQLATAAQSAPEQLAARMREAVATLPELCRAFGEELGVDDPDALRANALARVGEYETSTLSTLRTYALTVQVGEVVCDLLRKKAPQSGIRFDAEKGFRRVPQFGGVLDVLYFLLLQQLPGFRFCANCGTIYFRSRPDKNTCSQRCASLLGKRAWARRHRVGQVVPLASR